MAGFSSPPRCASTASTATIALIGDEPALPYQRPPLSKDYLDGKIGLDLLLMRPEAFYREHRIELSERRRGDARSTAPDKTGSARRRRAPRYDHLVLATGARNRVPPLPGIELDGVCYLRNLAETEALRERLAARRHVVVIGAGFIGLEFAAVARGNGKPVHIVELADRVMGRVVCARDLGAISPRRTADRGRVQLRRAGRAARRRRAARSATSCCATARNCRPISSSSASASCPMRSWPRRPGSRSRTASSSIASCLTADPDISAIGDCAAFPSRACAGEPGAARSGAERRRPRALRRRPAGRQAASLRGAAVVLERAGGAAAADRRADHRGTPGRAARRLSRAASISAFCYAGGHAARHRIDQQAGRPRLARRLLAAGRHVTPEQAADASFDLRAAATARAA